MPGKWIPASHARGAIELGCMIFEPEAMLVTHLVSLLERHAWRLIDTDSVAARLKQLALSRPELAAQARTKLGLARLRTILSNIARERVSVLDLPALLEAALSKAGRSKDPEVLTELARTGLRRSICRAFAGESGRLEAIVLSQSAEQLLAREFKRPKGLDALVGQRFLEALALEFEDAIEKGTRPVLLVDFELRPLVAGLTERVFPELPVVSWSEVDPEVEVDTVAVLGARFHPSARPYPSQRWSYS
jgi:flagellar biosynthesis protein FlhA